MITTLRPLKTKELIRIKKVDRNEKSVWCGVNQQEIITSKSWISLKLIMQWYNNSYNKKPIVYVSEYYCYETLYNLTGMAEICFYPIKSDFYPDMEKCIEIATNKKPDIFIFTHYFGLVLDLSSVKTFCKKNNTILIEDAAHVFFPEKGLGKYGDFVIYSPWKSYGLIDGAILIINKAIECSYKELKRLENQLSEFPEMELNKWRMKKIFQKTIPTFRNKAVNDRKHFVPVKESAYKVSKFSKSILLSIDEEAIQSIGKKKKENYMVLKEYLEEKYGVETIALNEQCIPYFLVIKIESKKDKICSELSAIGKIVSTWPTLDPDLMSTSFAINLKKSLLMVSTHDGINISRIAKAIGNIGQPVNSNLDIREISAGDYKNLCAESINPVPILQSVSYTSAKESVQGWKTAYWKISFEGSTIGFFVSLRKYGILYRINHGPILKDEMYEESSILNIKKLFGNKSKILFFAPNIEKKGRAMIYAEHLGLHYQEKDYTTGFIDLKEDIVKLRKNLDSKWRNALKSAEKKLGPICRAVEESEYEEMIFLHSSDKLNRNYKDSGDDITRYLCTNNHILGLYVKNEENNIISFIFLALHENTATYYIGWSNDEGYRANASRFLLWNGMILLKEMGYSWFDLGGIDFVHSKSIADFKKGTGCTIKRYMGEYRNF